MYAANVLPVCHLPLDFLSDVHFSYANFNKSVYYEYLYEFTYLYISYEHESL